MRLCSSLPANRSVCARRAPGEEVCRSRWTEHPPGGDFHLAISGDFEMAIDSAPRSQARVLFSFDHGSTFSFYFLDPEGNACEIYWPTGRRPSTTNRPIDLTLPVEELLQATAGR